LFSGPRHLLLMSALGRQQTYEMEGESTGQGDAANILARLARCR
jgi:hypothetical protein